LSPKTRVKRIEKQKGNFFWLFWLLYVTLITMKYIFLIPDGAADWPIKDLGNKTVLQTAKTPHMDKLAWLGKMGMLKTIPEGMTPGSECANMAIMGYRPEKDLTGRGPLEALSAGVEMQEHHLAFRCNIITIEQGRIKDYSSGHITTEESRPLVKYLQENLGERYEGIDFFPGVQYRHILRMDGNKFSEEINLTPPHDELDQLYREHLPKAKNKANKKAKETAEFITSLIEESNQFLESHEINKKRQSAAKNMATHIWPWSGGKKPQIESMKEKYGLNGSVISAVDLIFGLGIAAGLKPIHVEGQRDSQTQITREKYRRP